MSQEISGNPDLKCHICGLTFATQQEMEQHMKLEHQNKEEPTGVG
jgi:Zinc finger, C2H2 type